MRSQLPSAILILLSLISCKTVKPVSAELSSLQLNCKEPLPLQSYLKPDSSCTADAFYGTNPEEARKRDVSPWIPCNDVEWVDDTADLFGPSAENDATTLEQSTYARIYRDWLGAADRFTPDMAGKSFQNFDLPLSFNVGNPILESAYARTLKELIRGAKYNIVMDIFLIGGSWGAEILHDLGAAADRGVDVVLLHDNVSKFSVANEMDPLWQAAQQFSAKHPHFVALDANIHPPKRVSSLPFGLDQWSGIVSGLMDLNVSAEGRSDHSKILMVDALYSQSPGEYIQLKPSVFVSSRNMVDSAASFYHDEAVIIRGPAAVVALLHYQSDIQFAWDQAKKAKKVNADDEKLLKSITQRLDTLRSTPTLVQGQGWVSVQPLQTTANDELRNIDTSVIPRILSAERSIDLYGRIAYNGPLALALKEVMARGVKVRIILDQQTSAGALGNSLLPFMMADASVGESALPIKWFLPFRPGKTFASRDRSDLAQEIHAKTMIIDGRLALFGSANFDVLSWAGGFREYSVWVDDPALASESAREFDRLWNHPLLTVSHSVWMGDEAPPPAVQQYIEGLIKASGCDPNSDLCKAENVLQGGKRYLEKGPNRTLLKEILQREADRIKLLVPAKVLKDDKGMPRCRTL